VGTETTMNHTTRAQQHVNKQSIPTGTPLSNQSNSSSTILGLLPAVTPTNITKIPDPKEVINLISSGSNDDGTHLEEDDTTHLEDGDKKTDLDDSSLGRLPLTSEFGNFP
jgi:hypothetical protein